MPATSVSSPATVNRWQYLLKVTQLSLHCGVCIAVLLTLPLHKRYMPQLSAWWYQRLLVILNVQLNIQGTPPNKTVLVVSNHISWVDIVIFGSLLRPAFVSKAEVAKWPVVGPIARATGTVFLPRGAFKTSETSDTLAASLKHGRNVVLFPEATTSDAAIPHRFHARMFAAALDHSYPVQPIALRYLPENKTDVGNHPWAPWIDDAGLGGHLKKLLRLKELRVAVIFCPVISPDGHDRRGLAQASHSAITTALNQN